MPGPAREAAAVVGSHLAGVGDAAPGTDQTLVGVGFRDAVWPDAPSLDLLDGVTHGRATALISHDLHCVWLNSAAAQRYGVPVDADGLLREEPAFAVTGELGKLPDRVVDPWVQTAGQAAAARGVVGIVDFEMTWNRDAWLRRIAGGFASLRVEAGVYPQDLERAVAEGLRTGLEVAGSDGLLTVGPLKVLIDGSLNTRTAYCVDPYPNGGHGLLTVSGPELLALLVRARQAGFVPAVHAIGDAANRVALDAFEAAGIAGRVEHAQFVRSEDFARFGRLGVIASVQPAHALDDRDAAESNWPGRTDRAFPLRSLVAAGATLALGSDAPVAPLDPVDLHVRRHGASPAGWPRAMACRAGPHPARGPHGLDPGPRPGSGRGSGRSRRARRRPADGSGRRVCRDAGGCHVGGGTVYYGG